MNPNDIECKICGKLYHYCPHCGRYEKWMAHACCSEHYEIHLILTELREGIFDKEQAKNAFKNIGIDENYDFSKLLPAIARDIKKIIEEPIPKIENRTRRKSKIKK